MKFNTKNGMKPPSFSHHPNQQQAKLKAPTQTNLVVLICLLLLLLRWLKDPNLTITLGTRENGAHEFPFMVCEKTVRLPYLCK